MRTMDPRHRDLDQVGSGALERRVLTQALAERAGVEVLVLDLRDVAPALEQRLDVALTAGELHLAVEVRADTGEPLEILADERFGLFERDVQLARERGRPLTV